MHSESYGVFFEAPSHQLVQSRKQSLSNGEYWLDIIASILGSSSRKIRKAFTRSRRESSRGSVLATPPPFFLAL